MKRIKALLFTLGLTLSMLIPSIAMPIAVHADQIQDNLCKGANLQFSSDPTSCATSTSGAEGDINKIVTLVINIFSIVVGIIAVIMIIIGGVKYVTSGGDSNNITSAKNTIMYAIVGLVIVALAQILVRYVLGRVSSSTTSI